ncbi:MAG: ABC transporter substrate-binding protein [Thermosynechococcaceae cyanobacterium]
MHVVVFRLRGPVSAGVQVTLEWRPDHSFQTQGTLLGSLTPNTEITSLYAGWRRHYCDLGEATRLEYEASSEQRLDLRRKKQHAKQQCDQAARQLEDNFKQWLNTSSDFQRIARQLSAIYGFSERVRLLIRTDDPELQRLPWHLWEELQRRPTPISLGSLEHEQGQVSPLASPVRVLAIFGCDRNINLTPDLTTLNNIAKIDLTTLLQPQRHEVTQALRQEQGWDIIFFAGHSKTEDQQGILSINEADSLTSKDLHQHLKIAAANGLKICIFNSCDGLGLARHLSDLKIPYVIYMREPVPDQVAHRFFQSFIQHFSTQSCSIHDAVLAAQHDLEAIQDRFPYATWLPTLFQQPHAGALYWPQPQPKRKSLMLRPPMIALILLAIATGTFMVAKNHQTPPVQSVLVELGDSISTGEEILGSRPVPKVDAASAIAKLDYDSGVQSLLETWKTDGTDPETLIYLNNAIIDANQIRHNTIAVTVPFSKDNELAYRLLKGVAQAQTEANLKVGKLSSRLGVSFLTPNQIGPHIGLKVMIANDKYVPGNGEVADEKNVAKQAIVIAERLSKDREILGVVGHYASDMSEPTISIYKQHQLAMISPGSTATNITKGKEGYFFRPVPITKVEAQSVADYLIKKGKRKVMIYFNLASPFTYSFRNDFKAIYAKNGRIVESFEFASAEFDPKLAIAALKALSDPSETAFLLVPDGEVSMAQENAFKLIEANAGQYPIVGSWGMDHPKTLEMFKKYPSSLVVSVPWHHSTSPNSDFSKQSKQLWNQTVRGQTALAYDATRAFIEAFRRQKTPSRQGTRDVLADPSFKTQGATGTIAFDEKGDRKFPPQTLIKAVQCGSNIEFISISRTCPAAQRQVLKKPSP